MTLRHRSLSALACLLSAGPGLVACLGSGDASERLAASMVAGPPYPCPVEVVIHSKYGGGTDVTARLMVSGARRRLGVDMRIVPKVGGAGVAAQNYVMSRPADGCTLLALTPTHLYAMARGRSNMHIDDIVGVARAMDDPTLVAVGAASDFATLDDLIGASAAAPLTWGVARVGGTEHVGLALLAQAVGVEYRAVPFGSGMQMIHGVLSGAVDATLPNLSEARAQMAGGGLRPLAVLAAERLEDYPDIPTAEELGYGLVTSTTRGYVVRAGTPADRIEALSHAVAQAMRDEPFAAYLSGIGISPERSVAGPEMWTRQVHDEYQRATAALRLLGVVPPQ